MYTIGQVSAKTGIPVSTLRYYDKEGLFPQLRRESGIRKFSDRELETLQVIDCLKKSGLEIKDIKRYMAWCTQGNETLAQRRALFLRQKETVEQELQRLEKTLDMLKYKCWFYEKAMETGSEAAALSTPVEALPEEIRQAYLHAHEETD